MINLLSTFLHHFKFLFSWLEPFLPPRLEYEQNRDMESRIKELESSLSALENDLEQVQEKETEAKLSAEKAISEIKHWNEEVEGMTLFLSVFHYEGMTWFILPFYHWEIKASLVHDFCSLVAWTNLIHTLNMSYIPLCLLMESYFVDCYSNLFLVLGWGDLGLFSRLSFLNLLFLKKFFSRTWSLFSNFKPVSFCPSTFLYFCQALKESFCLILKVAHLKFLLSCVSWLRRAEYHLEILSMPFVLTATIISSFIHVSWKFHVGF